MTLLTLLSPSNRLASESLPPSYSPWLEQPTFSPVTLTHNLVIHTYHQSLYITHPILYLEMLWFGLLRLDFTYPRLAMNSDPPASMSEEQGLHMSIITFNLLSAGNRFRDFCRLSTSPAPQKVFSLTANTENNFSLTLM